jgi:hypothetical protein
MGNVIAKEVFDTLTKPSAPQERAFFAFFEALLSGATIADGVDTMQATANVSRFFRDYGIKVVNLILDCTPFMRQRFLCYGPGGRRRWTIFWMRGKESRN